MSIHFSDNYQPTMFGDDLPINDSGRRENDFYPTPLGCAEKIFNEIDFNPDLVFLEPCRGAGVIYDNIPTCKTKLYAELSEGIDYFDHEFEADLIITNPPFSFALDFLQKSLDEALTVCYLLRLSFLGSKERQAFWTMNPLTHLFVLSERPSFTGDGTDNSEYAWYVWDQIGLIKRPRGVYAI